MNFLWILQILIFLFSQSTVKCSHIVDNPTTSNLKIGVGSSLKFGNTTVNRDDRETKRDLAATMPQRVREEINTRTHSPKLNVWLPVYSGQGNSNLTGHSTTVEHHLNVDTHRYEKSVTSDHDDSIIADKPSILADKSSPSSSLTEGNSEELQILPFDVYFGKGYINHVDHFKCNPCNCSTREKEKLHVKATCQNQNMYTIPKNLPNHLWSLQVQKTPLLRLNISRLLEYPTLNEVNISFNKRLSIVDLMGDVTNMTSQVSKMWLTTNNITCIGDFSFSVFPSLRILSLHDNKLQNIRNATFDMLGNLTSLDLSCNVIHFIESGAFSQLKLLRTLDLSYNYVMNYTEKYFPSHLFASLRKLEELSIQGHSKNLDVQYPEVALSQLLNLKSLHVDGLNTSFGKGVKFLEHLSHLMISFTGLSRRCRLGAINSTFFINLPHLKSLEVTSCPLSYIDPLAYKKVNLTSLSLSYLSKYDLFTAFNDLRGLQNSSLKNLSFVHLYHTAMPCRFLKKDDAKYLQNIALEVLDLSDNRLALLGDDFALSLPKTLTRLILRNNRFALSGLIVTQVNNLTRLIEIDISIQNQLKPEYFQALASGAQESYFIEGNQVTFETEGCPEPGGQTMTGVNVVQNSSKHFGDHRFQNRSVDTENIHKYQISHCEELEMLSKSIQGQQIKFPPNLRYLKASQYYDFGTILLHNSWSKNKLSEIDFSRSFLTNWGKGHIHHHITKIDLSENYCKHIWQKFFKANNSLIYLDMHNNALGADFAEDNEGSILAELSYLKYLDISYNLIYKLPPEFFKGLIALETLRLFENKLQVLNTTFSHMTRLSYLDLSRNSIIWITEKVRNDLDQIGEQLLVDLTLNPLPCTCSAIDLLNWMATTKVQLQGKEFLQCRFEDGEIEFIGDLEQRVTNLKRTCASKALVIVICVASIVVVGIIVAAGLIYKNRWKLRYLFNTAKARFFGFKPKSKENFSFKFDAYFIYTDETHSFVLRDCIRELEEKRGHKLCVEDRDFMPGSPVIADILSGVRNSHKTVPVITPDFYSSGDFTEYSVKMALMEEIYERRQVLHLCIFELMKHCDMDNDLLVVMKRNSYTEYPPLVQATEELIQNFWDKLSEKIGHSSQSGWDKVVE